MFRLSTQGSLSVHLNLKKTAIKLSVRSLSFGFPNSWHHPYTVPNWTNRCATTTTTHNESQSLIRPWSVDSPRDWTFRDNKTANRSDWSWFDTRLGSGPFSNSFPYDGASRFGMMQHAPCVPAPFGIPAPCAMLPFVTSPYVPAPSMPFNSMPFDPMPFEPMPFSSMPFSSMPFSSMPFDSMPFDSMPFSSMPFSSMPFSSMPFKLPMTVPFSSPVHSDVAWFHRMKPVPFAASPWTDRAFFDSWPKSWHASTVPFHLPFTVPFSGFQMKPTSMDRTLVGSGTTWPVFPHGYSDADVATIPNWSGWWNRSEDASTRIVTRHDVTMLFLYAKNAQRLTFTDIAHKIGRSEVWTTSAILGQQEMSHREAELMCGILGFDKDAKLKSRICVLLTEPPMRGWNDAVPVDPTLYRFFEILQVYGSTFKALINEKFGDGVMSAVDLKVDLEKGRQPMDGTPPRIKITFDGAFEPYRPW